MKTIALSILTGIAALSSASAALITLDATRSLGSIAPGTPAGQAFEEGYVNFLLTETANGTGVLNGFNNSGLFSNSLASISTGGQTYTLNPGALVQQGGTVLGLSFKDDKTATKAFTLGATPGAWLLAKFGNGFSEVFFIGDLGGQEIQVPASSTTGDGKGLSHYSLFRTTTTTTKVPDGGATLILLGAALGGIGIARRAAAKI